MAKTPTLGIRFTRGPFLKLMSADLDLDRVVGR